MRLSKEKIGEILRQLRIDSNLTQAEVANKIGRKRQIIGHWETGYSQPDADTLFLLCDLYGASVDAAFGFKHRETLSVPERDLLAKYRVLDAHGKTIIESIAKIEKERIDSAKKEKRSFVRMVEMKVYNEASAAGFSNPLSDESDENYTMMKYPDDEIPYGADFGIRISGESMEPTIMNDSIVWVKKMDAVDNGDIGIFIYANGAVCKQLYYDNRNVLLKSINPAFEPINVTGDDSLKTVGRVLI